MVLVAFPGILPVDHNAALIEWRRLRAKVKTREDYNKLSEDDKRLFRACNILFAPSFSLETSKRS